MVALCKILFLTLGPVLLLTGVLLNEHECHAALCKPYPGVVLPQ